MWDNIWKIESLFSVVVGMITLLNNSFIISLLITLVSFEIFLSFFNEKDNLHMEYVQGLLISLEV